MVEPFDDCTFHVPPSLAVNVCLPPNFTLADVGEMVIICGIPFAIGIWATAPRVDGATKGKRLSVRYSTERKTTRGPERISPTPAVFKRPSTLVVWLLFCLHAITHAKHNASTPGKKSVAHFSLAILENSFYGNFVRLITGPRASRDWLGGGHSIPTAVS